MRHDELNLRTDRESVFRAIDSEREYQASHWPCNDGAGGEPVRTVAEELLMIEEYAARARKVWTDCKRTAEVPEVTNFMRNIAAIAVRAMENHGAPGREGYGVFVPQIVQERSDDDMPF